jgi:hypothetical protein
MCREKERRRGDQQEARERWIFGKISTSSPEGKREKGKRRRRQGHFRVAQKRKKLFVDVGRFESASAQKPKKGRVSRRAASPPPSATNGRHYRAIESAAIKSGYKSLFHPPLRGLLLLLLSSSRSPSPPPPEGAENREQRKSLLLSPLNSIWCAELVRIRCGRNLLLLIQDAIEIVEQSQELSRFPPFLLPPLFSLPPALTLSLAPGERARSDCTARPFGRTDRQPKNSSSVFATSLSPHRESVSKWSARGSMASDVLTLAP